MEHTYTHEQLVQFIYQETNLFDHFEIENALLEDIKLKDTYDEMLKSYLSIPKVRFYPKRRAIDQILSYSRLAA